MRKAIQFLILTFLTSVSASTVTTNADPDAKAAADLAKFVIRSTTRVMNSQKFECYACRTDAGKPTVPPACFDAWSDLYSKPELNFNVALGYSEGPLGANDGTRRAVWSEKLTRPCQENADAGTCGFRRADDTMDLYTKSVIGPDRKPHLVKLHLVSSAASRDDKANRTTRRAEQTLKTKKAEDTFFGGLENADVVIYAGHARKGAGPSFGPPPGSDLHVNYSALKGNVNEARMLTALKRNPKPPKLVGIFACDADKWFSDQVRAATIDRRGRNLTGVATSDGLTDAEVVFAQAYAMLDSILAMRCEDEFQASLGAIREFGDADVGIRHPKPAHIDGFYSDFHPEMWDLAANIDAQAEVPNPQTVRSETPLSPDAQAITPSSTSLSPVPAPSRRAQDSNSTR